MDQQKLYELADEEIRLGTHDRVLMARALEEAGGVTTHAHQIYWRLRATAIKEEAQRNPGVGDELYVRELRARLDAEGKNRKLRANLIGWMWVVVCFAGFAGSFVCFRVAKSAFYRGTPGFYVYAVTGAVCLVLAIIAYIISKRDAGQDPFAD